jgi:hypothetical protein
MTRGHVFGALALHILGTHRISTATRSLKIVLSKEVIHPAAYIF